MLLFSGSYISTSGANINKPWPCGSAAGKARLWGAQVGLGGPVLLQGAKRGGGGLPVRLTNGILLLGAQSVRSNAPPALCRSGGLL